MRLELATLKRVAVVALLFAPFAAWAFYKPVRLLARSLAGVSCTDTICTDAPSRIRDANERLGMYRIHRGPDWFIEGMAYSLSEDPRDKLAEPFERYRSQFEVWFRAVGKEHLWEQARKL